MKRLHIAGAARGGTLLRGVQQRAEPDRLSRAASPTEGTPPERVGLTQAAFYGSQGDSSEQADGELQDLFGAILRDRPGDAAARWVIVTGRYLLTGCLIGPSDR